MRTTPHKTTPHKTTPRQTAPVRARPKAAALAATIGLVGLALAGCGSSASSSSGSSSPGSGSGKGALKEIGTCLSAKGADPADLLQALSGGAPLTAAQLKALRKAAPACASSVPSTLSTRAAKLATCLTSHGLTMSGSDPLDQILSLDLTKAPVVTKVQHCDTGAKAAS